MANTIFKLRRSSVAGKKPTTTDISIGELAINLTDRKLYSSDGSNTWEIGANLSTLDVSANTSVNNIIISGGLYANGSIGSGGQVLATNGSSIYWTTSSGTGTVTSISSGNGLEGGPITSNGTLSVLANNGIVANATGVYVNATYIGTLSSNNTTFVNGKNEGDLNVNSALTANNSTNLGGVAASGYQTTAGLSANVATLTSNNSSFLGGTAAASYQLNSTLNANIASYLPTYTGVANAGTLQVGSSVVANSSRLTIGTGVGLSANGGLGSAGQTLHSNGTTIYWADDDQGVTSVSGTSGRITSSGGTTPTIDLATAGAGAGSYSSGISALTVDAYGRVTSVTGSASYATTTQLASYLPLAGGTMTGALTIGSTTDQQLTLNATDNSWQYIGFSHSGTRKAYFGIDGSGNPIWGTDSGSFTITGNFTTIGTSARSPIFYDSDDTGYYTNPNGTSNMYRINLQNYLYVYGGTALACEFVGGWGQYGKVIQVRTDGAGGQDGPHIWYHKQNAKSWGAGIEPYSSNGFAIYEDGSTGAWGTQRFRIDPGGPTWALVDMRSPIFYDSNNTGRYCDPNNISLLEDCRASIFYDVYDTNYYIQGRSISYLNDLRPNIVYDRNDTFYYNDLNSSRRFAGRTYIHEWIEFVNFSALYSPNNGAHFYPNNASYGSWRLSGSRNGWAGLEFENSNTSLMMNTDVYGFHWNSTGWRFYLEGGNAYFPANVTAYWSDRRLKENLRPIGNEAIQILSKLTAYRFNWNDKVEEFKIDIKPGKEEIGLIAQEVQAAIPDAVVVNKSANKANIDGTETESNYLTINWNKITPLLVQALNDTTRELAELKQLLKDKGIL